MEAASSEFDRLLHFLGEDAGHVRCRLLQALFESMSEGLAVIDQEGRTVVVNDRLASLLGRSAEQLSGQLLLDLVDARDRGSVARALQAGSDREGGPHEFRLLRQDTIPMHVVGTFAPLTSSDGATRGVVVLTSDVTWPREIEDQLRWRLRYEEAAAFCAQALVGTVNLDDVIPRVCRNETTRVLVFRAVRELLMNVVKHSGATEARVALSQGVASIHIVVEDNGRGFDTREVHTRSGPAGGFGLFDIRERLAHIGGRLDVSSKPGSGVRATMFVPLNQRGARRPEVTCDEHTNTIGR